MNRRSVKKVKRFRLSQEYQSAETRGAIPTVEKPIQSFTPSGSVAHQYAPHVAAYSAEGQEQAAEYFKVGLSSGQQSQTSKKTRGKSPANKPNRPRQPGSVNYSNTIDTPTIIHNILSTPIQSNGLGLSNTASARTVNFELANGSQNDLGEIMTSKSRGMFQTVDDTPYSKSRTQNAINIEEKPQSEATDSQVKQQLLHLLENNMRMTKISPAQHPRMWTQTETQAALLKNFLESSKRRKWSKDKHLQAKSVSPDRVQVVTSSVPFAPNVEGVNLQDQCLSNYAYLSSDCALGEANILLSARKPDKKTAGSLSPPSKRQASAPKARNAREKRNRNHLAGQTSSQLRIKKRANNSSASRNSGQLRSLQNHILLSAYAGNEVRKDLGRPPNPNSLSSVQTRGCRDRTKNWARQAEQRVRGSSLPATSSQKKGQLAASLQTMNVLKGTVTDQSPIKSLAAIAVSMRQNICQTALLQHKNNGQGCTPQQLFQVASAQSPHFKDFNRALISSSGRVASKRELMEREQQSLNTLTQSVSKINAWQHVIGGKTKAVQSSSKRNELASYLSKILNQQQTVHMNTQDQTYYAHYTSTGNESAQKMGTAAKSQRGSQGRGHSKAVGLQAPASVGNSAYLGRTNTQKRLSGVVLLNGQVKNRQSVGKTLEFDPNVQTRKSHPSSNSKREWSCNENQEQTMKQALSKLTIVKELTQSQPSLQYMKIAGKSGGAKAATGACVNAAASGAGSQNSLLLMHHKQKLLNQENQLRAKAKNPLRLSQELVKGGAANADLLRNQNFWHASKIQRAIYDRKEVLEKIEFAKAEFSAVRPPFTKSVSERNIIKTPKEDLIGSEHTIVNIKAYESDESVQENQGECDLKSKSRSTRVEYHSDRLSIKMRELVQVREPSPPALIPYAAKEVVEVGVQTSSLTQQASPEKESEESVSHRENKIASPHETPPSKTLVEKEEQEFWAREKLIIEAYSLFFEEEFAPFTRDLLLNLGAEPQRLSKVGQQLDIFGVRLEQFIGQTDYTSSVTSSLFYNVVANQIMSLQRLAKFSQNVIARIDSESRSAAMEKEDQIEALKDQVRKLQKELFIRGEKLHLSEQMNKLKEKEVTTLRNKINAMLEAGDRQNKEHARVISRKEHEQELNFAKAARELKTLYEQNKELFEHNKALRYDLQDQDEKVRKLVNVIQRHPSILLQIETELDRTETMPHDKSQISNAIPVGRKSSQEYYSMSQPAAISGEGAAKHGLVYVGQNKVPIPRFDPSIIAKYNQLNIEGKLPHIVETNKFDPDAVKQQVKEIFRNCRRQQNDIYEERPSEEFQSPELHGVVVYPQHSSSGIGNDTPFSPSYNNNRQSCESDSQRQFFHDSCNDVSGGERKQCKQVMLHNTNSAHNQYQRVHVKVQEPQHQSSHGYLQSGFQQAQQLCGLDLNTPVQKTRKVSGAFNAGPKKEISHTQLGLVKQHQPHTIVTLQNQLYHQLVTKNNNPSGSHGTPNNHQVPTVNSMREGSIQRSLKPKSQQHQNRDDCKLGGRTAARQNTAEFDGSCPDYQSVDQPMLQTPSQTATLALELTDGLNQLMMQQSLDICASTAAFNQILINDEPIDDHLSPHRRSLNQQVYLMQMSRARAQNHDFAEKHHYRKQVPSIPDLIHHVQHYNGAMYEEEKEGTYSYSNEPVTAGGGDSDMIQQTHLNVFRNHQQGPTLQDQISKQYSPILRRHESLEQLNDFSPSLINDRNELSSAAQGYKGGNATRMQAMSCALVETHQKTSIYSLIERGGFMGLTSMDPEKSASLLDSIAIREEDQTQKRCMVPPISNCIDHGGNEQTSTNQIIVEIEQQQQFQQPFPLQHLARQYYNQSPVLDSYSYMQTSQPRVATDQKNNEFDGGEPPLDISRVDHNFVSSENLDDDHSGQDSADFLEDQNFQQQLHVGRRSSYDGHYYVSPEQM